MPKLGFYVMAAVMRIRGHFRDKEGEVLLTGIKPGDVVLDYGCGPGFSTVPAAKIVGERGKVYALDIHPLAIKAVNKKVRQKGLENVEMILSDLDTGIPDESVDIVLLYNVLPMIEDRPSLLKEMYRILKPGGLVSVKTGLGAKLYSRRRISEYELMKLMEHSVPLKLKKKTGKFYVFGKSISLIDPCIDI